MVEKPRYFDSWKGKIAKAIVKENARTWVEIRDATGLSRSSLNRVLSEMLNAQALEKAKDNTYKLEYNLYKSYKNYFDTESDEGSRSRAVSITQAVQKDLLQWLFSWKDEEAPHVDLKHGHFFITGDKLDELSKKMLDRSKKEILVINPYVKTCSLSDKLRDNHSAVVTLITRFPKENNNEYQEKNVKYHKSLKDKGVNLFYNERTHAKIIIVDRTIAIVSSLNFYGGSSAGTSWEAGIITKEESVIEQMVIEFLKLLEAPETNSQS